MAKMAITECANLLAKRYEVHGETNWKERRRKKKWKTIWERIVRRVEKEEQQR